VSPGFNLADIFESVADAIPDREALICGDRRLTYSQLEERANRLAHHLQAHGVVAGAHVGLYMINGTEYVEAMIACLKIRAVPINVNYRYVEEELRYLFDDADLVAVLHHRKFGPRIDTVKGRAPKLQHVVTVDDGSGEPPAGVEYEGALAGASPTRDFPPRSGDDLFVIYTGGTTGIPKGVMWRQEDLFFTGMGGGNPQGPPVEGPEGVATNAVGRFVLTQFPVPPLIHGAAQLGVFIGLNWGDRVLLIPRFDPVEVWDAAAREHANTLTIVGDAMARPMAEVLQANPGRWDLSSVVYVGSAGAVMSEHVKEQLRALLPNTIVTENFGATETGYQGMAAPGASGMRFVMNPNTTVFDDDLRPLEPGSGTIGRLALRGRVPLGYYKDAAKTAANFVEVDGVRWVMQGDLATVEPDGTITVFGRGALCINTGGEKVFPEEVEAAVRAHPDVYDAVVVGVPDERWGERVAAIAEPRPGRQPALADVQSHCRTLIAGYKVPRELHLVDRLLRQPSGKPDYRWAKSVAMGATEPPVTGEPPQDVAHIVAPHAPT